MSQSSIKIDVSKNDSSYVIKVQNGGLSSSLSMAKTSVGYAPQINRSAIIELIVIGFAGLLEDGKLPDKEKRAFYRQMIEVFITSQFVGGFFRKRRYASRKFLRSLSEDDKNNILMSDVWKQCNSSDDKLPFLNRLTLAIVSAPATSCELTTEDVQKALFTSLFKCQPSVFEVVDSSAKTLIEFFRRHSEWYNEITGGPNSQLFNIGNPRHATMISHRFRDLCHKIDCSQPEDLFFQALYMSLGHLTSCFVYVANAISQKITFLPDFDDVSKKIFSSLFFPQKWFGNIPLLLWLSYEPRPRQGKRKTSKQSLLECVPPVFEMLHILGEWHDGFEPWQVHRICSYYYWLNDLERMMSTAVPADLSIKEDGGYSGDLGEIAECSNEDAICGYGQGGSYELDGGDEEIAFYEYMASNLPEKDNALFLDCVSYVGKRSMPWKSILKKHPNYNSEQKVRDYWRKTLSLRLKERVKEFKEKTCIEDKKLIALIDSLMRSL